MCPSSLPPTRSSRSRATIAALLDVVCRLVLKWEDGDTRLPISFLTDLMSDARRMAAVAGGESVSDLITQAVARVLADGLGGSRLANGSRRFARTACRRSRRQHDGRSGSGRERRSVTSQALVTFEQEKPATSSTVTVTRSTCPGIHDDAGDVVVTGLRQFLECKNHGRLELGPWTGQGRAPGRRVRRRAHRPGRQAATAAHLRSRSWSSPSSCSRS